MKSRFLFNNKYKPLGWVLFICGLVLGIILTNNEYEILDLTVKVFNITGGDDIGFDGIPKGNSRWILNNISDEVTSVLLIIGGVLVSFSKTKDEDEYISKIRMESLIWATYVNYGVLLFTIIFIYGGDFLDVMIYNMFTMLVFFILRFHYVLYKLKRGVNYEE